MSLPSVPGDSRRRISCGLAIILTVPLCVSGGDDREPSDTPGAPPEAAGRAAPNGPQEDRPGRRAASTAGQQAPAEVRPPAPREAPVAPEVANVDLTGLPDIARNVVLVRSEHPPRAANGIYFLQQSGRSFVVCTARPVSADGRMQNLRFNVDLYPGQSDQQTVPARLLVQLGSLAYLELVGALPPPVEMDLQPEVTQPQEEEVRVFGFHPASPVASDRLTWAELGVRQSAEDVLTVPREDMPGGALVCDQQGRAFAMLGHFDLYRQQMQPNLPRGLFTFERIVELTRLRGGGSLDLSEGPMQFLFADGTRRPVCRLSAGYTDPLRRVRRMQLLVGSFNRIKSGLSFDRGQFDEPATSDMRPVPLQRRRGRDPSENLYDGLLLLPSGTDRDSLDVVTQLHFQLEDGSDFYGQPQLMLSDRPLKVAPLTEELLARFADRRVTDADDMDFNPSNEPVPVELNRNVVGREWDHGDARAVLYGLAKGTGSDRENLLSDYAWSADGQFVFFVSRFGRIDKVRVADRTEVRTIDLLAWCVDLDMSAIGPVVLGHQKLWVLDEDTLEVKAAVDVPEAFAVATGTEARHAVVMSRDQLQYVDLEAGVASPLSIVGAEAPAIPDESFIGIGMANDGRHLFLADDRRLHRLGMTREATLTWEESTPPFEFVKQLILPPGSRRVAVRLSEQQLVRPGYPYGAVMVYSQDDLQVPTTGLSGHEGFVLDPASGGTLQEFGLTETRWLREDGRTAAFLTRHIDLDYGSANPVQPRLLVYGDSQLREYTFPDDLVSRDSLRTSHQAPADPVEVNRPLKSETQQVDGWTVSTLDLPLNEKLLPQSRARDRLAVESCVWTPAGDACFLLTTDHVLHRIRVPEWVEDRRLASLEVSGLQLSSEGLVAPSRLRQELIVIDPVTLDVRDHLPVAFPVRAAASPLQSRVWFIRGDTLRLSDAPFVSSVDVATRQTGRDHTLRDIITMLHSIRSKYDLGSLEGLYRMAATPDGRYLFLSDGRNLVRFRIDGDTLVLQDATNALSYGMTGPIVISHDSKLVALPGGNRRTRPTHDFPRNGRGNGSLVFPVDDFSTVAIPALTDDGGHALTINTVTGEVYTRTHEISLQVLAADGAIRQSVQLPGRQEVVEQFSIDPRNRGLLMLGERVLWAEPPAR